MVNIIDCSTEEFKKRIRHKRLFLFGAGVRAQMYYRYLSLDDKVEIIIDNNEKLRYTAWHISPKVKIVNLEDFIKLIQNEDISSIAILVTPIYFAMDVIEQLNSYSELEGMDCYIGSIMITHYTKKEFDFTYGERLIPKKIHYCWFGKADIPEELQKCIKSWKKYCPDYEIIRWDESNYDVTKNRYMYEAYQNKKWGFVPDYARLDIIYNEGGIYLDTDVELIASLDKLLNDKMFCGMTSELGIALGLGFGAVANDFLVGECRDAYNDLSFYKDDKSLNLCPCCEYQAPVFERNGFKICNEYQKIRGHVIYPSEVLSPTMYGEASTFTNRTVSIHHNATSWIEERQKKGHNKLKEYMMNRKTYM